MTRTATCLLATAAAAIALPAHASAATLVASLAGANETHEGDASGTGVFTADADVDSGDLCYTLAAEIEGEPMAAHIHKGAAGTDGAPVVTLEITGPEDDICMAVEPDVLKPILASPADYYVNVHSAAYPKGAVRGQLEKGG